MKNLWIQPENEFAIWRADIAPLVADPDRLLQLAAAIFAAGNSHSVYTTGELGMQRLRALWDEQRVINFATRALRLEQQVTARMAWYDKHDSVVEGNVSDLSEILRSFEIDSEILFDAWMEPGNPPLRIIGLRYPYQGEPPHLARRASEETIGFQLQSDIWFPFIRGSAHPDADYSETPKLFDNRELALRHTPRLNGFLREVRAAVVAAGGGWLVPESVRTIAPWVADDGILLDGPVPGLIPPDVVARRWWTSKRS